MQTHKNKKILIFIFLLLLSLFSYSHLSFASTTVEPARILLTAKPGGRVTGTITVTNPGDKEADVTAVIYDWTLNDTDRMVTSEVGTRQDSLKGLIKFNPQSFKLAPGDSQVVRFTLTAPKEGNLIEHRGIVYFEENMPSNAQDGIGANVVTQVGSTIYLSMEGMRMAFNFVKALVERANDGKYQGVMEIMNQGSGHVRYRVSYKLINANKTLINETQIPERVILPGFNRRVSFPLPEKLEPGKYNLLLTVEFWGTAKSISRNIPFTVQ